MNHKCQACGKFIRYQDILDGKCKFEEIWSWDKIELEDVVYWCVKCTEKK